MKCLGIETSCDETAVAVWADGALHQEAIHTQIPMHAVFGGVVPELASREHLRKLDTLVRSVLGSFNEEKPDCVAVTRGPGLLGALLVGIAYAKALALAWKIPVIGVNHLQAHLLACDFIAPIGYPAIGVLVSGGHTHIYRMTNPHEFLLLGKTLDDAAGEAFDKIAKLLNLPYPGGKYIDILAAEGVADPKLFSCPYLHNDNCDFSFSGLKTAVANFVQKNPMPGLSYGNFETKSVPQEIKNLCATVNTVVVDTLLEKTRRAMALYPDIKTLCVAGGVAANGLLRTRFAALARSRGIKFLVPAQNYCGDNAAMVAYAGSCLAGEGLASRLDFEAVPRGRNVPFDYMQKTSVRSE